MLERLKQEVSIYRKARRWYIAYSGGLDSHVLLHALTQLKAQEPTLPQLIAVHINHQLQQVAGSWELHCQQQAQALSVEFESHKVIVDSRNNIEARAREARYQVFSDVLEANDYIFLAHHQQDQIETFFYRLFRGAGIKGLSSISKERSLGAGHLVRPMLMFSREEITRYAQHHQLNYIQDPSNDNTDFDRNYIRHQLLPVIQQRWPVYSNAVQRAISHSQESATLLDEFAQEDLSTFNISSEAEREPWLELNLLHQYSLIRQKNILRFWLQQWHLQLSERQFNELINNVIAASNDANPQLIIGEKVLRRFQNKLYITDLDSTDLDSTELDSTLVFEPLEWHGRAACVVVGYGVLALSLPVDIRLMVAPRMGGEMIKPAGSKHTRKLKTLLQEMLIPPWQRQRLPLIYYGDELIAVGDIIYSASAKKLLKNSTIIRTPIS